MADPQALRDLSLKLQKGYVPTSLSIKGWSTEYPFLDHQKTGISYLILNPSCLVADETGLGKTLQGLALVQYLISLNKVDLKQGRVILIVPAYALYGSWEKDGIQKFLPDLNYAIGRGTKKQRLKVYEDESWDVLLTNYETIRQDWKEVEKLHFSCAILDEVEVLKNPDALITKATKKITKKCKRVVGLTATPVQTNLEDLWSIFDALNLSRLLGSRQFYNRRYMEWELTKGFDPRTKKRYVIRKCTGYKNTEELKKKIRPYILRRTLDKIDPDLLPQLQSQIVWLPMNDEQKKLYEHYQNKYANLDPKKDRQKLMSAVYHLRRIAISPALVDGTPSSPKFDYLIGRLLNQWKKDKVVLFASEKDTIELFEARMQNEGIKYIKIIGEVSQVEREKLRQRFWNEPDLQVVIGTTAICRSLNFQCARIQANINFMWIATPHVQLVGRVKRLFSLHKKVMMVSPAMIGSIEEAMVKSIQKREAIASHILDDDAAVFEKLDSEDLHKLINFKPNVMETLQRIKKTSR